MSECEHRFVGHIYDAGLGIEFYYCQSCKKTSEEVKLEEERDELKARVKFLNGALDLVLVNITQNITSARQEIEDEYGYDYFEREGE